MGLLSIFKRKPGGTFVGNLFRGVGKVIGGKKLGLGQGKMMISQEDYDRKNGVSTQPLVPGDPSTQVHNIDEAIKAVQAGNTIPVSDIGTGPGVTPQADSGPSLGQQILNLFGGALLETPEGQEAAKTAVISKAKSTWATLKPFAIIGGVAYGGFWAYKKFIKKPGTK